MPYVFRFILWAKENLWTGKLFRCMLTNNKWVWHEKNAVTATFSARLALMLLLIPFAISLCTFARTRIDTSSISNLFSHDRWHNCFALRDTIRIRLVGRANAIVVSDWPSDNVSAPYAITLGKQWMLLVVVVVAFSWIFGLWTHLNVDSDQN